MLNRVVLVGRLTKDPELRYTANGVAVATFTLAVNRPFSNQQGNREADFINCVIWRKPAENVANFLKKGSLAGVDGRIQTRSYDNNEGRRVYVTEIVADSVQFLEPRNASGGGNREQYGSGYDQQQGQGNSGYQQNPPNPGPGQGFSQGNQGRPSNQPNNDDPFANDGKPIDISDDDLPF
ncbi:MULTISPECIES: single-stranded DNA-binding protein [Bacillaceae]|uniref:Single-stranded DNA-binding protein n=1 Tax=Evansella alkalicola TaxID=745819 RepID=A0ABS6JUS3_9BACI|nr:MULTISPECIES: single-stranded DNA-binding protein [Bacillaceae]MBU9722315.1 single-stranded DNA-binding protein [Bacillus alkalicola]